MGVSGSGKTTIGEALSIRTGLPFFDGDDFHPSYNKEKMKRGHSLNDEDRQGWLEQLNTLAIQQQKSKGAIIACSALKEKYRSILSFGVQQKTWIFLQGSYEVIYDRMKERDHFMPVHLLHSQFEALEIPVAAFTVDIVNDRDNIVELIVQYLNDQQALPKKV
jgi:carbohydrate kinase (thermoresistant glucokinase family)